MANCRGCGADILWVDTVNGRKMPVDPELVEIDIAGPKLITVITDEGKLEMGSKVDRSGLFLPDKVVTGRVSHFATCLRAGSFRR